MIAVSPYYTNKCRGCGQDGQFKRSRQFVEVQYLELDETSDVARIDSEDTEGPSSEWEYECIGCGLNGSDLEDILEEAEDPEDDD